MLLSHQILFGVVAGRAHVGGEGLGHPRSSMNAPVTPKQSCWLACTVSPTNWPTYTAACAARLRCHHFLQAASNIRERESAQEALFPFSTPTIGKSESHQGEALGKLFHKFSVYLPFYTLQQANLDTRVEKPRQILQLHFTNTAS